MSPTAICVPGWSSGVEALQAQQGATERTIGPHCNARCAGILVVGQQPLHRQRFAFEVDNQCRVGAAIEGEFGPALQIALQNLGRSTFDRRTAGLPNDNCTVMRRRITEPQSANSRGRAARFAQLSQKALLAAEKPLALKGETERRQAAGALA